MQFEIHRTMDELAHLEPDWRRLAGDMPLLGPDWLVSWWRHYGPAEVSSTWGRWCAPTRELAVVTLRHGGRLAALAPWYVETSAWGWRTVRFLGSGEVCTDYLSVLVDPSVETTAPAELADWLLTQDADADDPPRFRWHQISLEGIDAADGVMERFANRLGQRGALVHRRQGENTWRLKLPESWDALTSSLSKSHRKFVRRLDKNVLAGGGARWHTAGRDSTFDEAWQVLVHLHQKRRQSLGEPGCFASPRYRAFHEEAARRLLERNQLRLHWLEIDGRSAAAEYHLSGDGVVYGYQSGLDPDLLNDEPGRLAMICFLKDALNDGFRAVDLMRGDEPYKAHWRAEPRPQTLIDILPGGLTDVVPYTTWQARAALREWLGRSGRHTALDHAEAEPEPAANG